MLFNELFADIWMLFLFFAPGLSLAFLPPLSSLGLILIDGLFYARLGLTGSSNL